MSGGGPGDRVRDVGGRDRAEPVAEVGEELAGVETFIPSPRSMSVSPGSTVRTRTRRGPS
jgi:hypothetical protein